MAEVKLKEEQELWEPQEEDNSVGRALKEEPDCGGVQSHEEADSTAVHVKEEPEEVKIKQETNSDFPFLRVIVKNEDEEEESVQEAVKEETREESDGESSSETDDSEDWTPSAESPHAQTQTAQQQVSAHGDNYNEDWGPDKPHKCSHCGKEFANSSTLRTHVRCHLGERPFKCSVCSKNYITNRHLTTHMRIHTGEKPFKCSVCAMTFSRITHLKTHMCTQTGGKPFRCPTCAKGFAVRGNLKNHMKTHTIESSARSAEQKQFGCNVCAQEFSARSTLYRHKVSHKEQLRYKCSVCARGYVRKGTRDRHEKTHKEPTSSVGAFSCTVCKTHFQRSGDSEDRTADGRLVINETCSKCLLNKFCPIRPKPAQSQLNDQVLGPGPVQRRVGRKRTRGRTYHRRLLTIAPDPKGMETCRLFVLESRPSNDLES